MTFVDPNAGEPEPAVTEEPETEPPVELPRRRAGLTLARVALEPEGTAAEAAFLQREVAAVVQRVRSWDEPKQDALAEAREHAFWQSPDRYQVLSLIEYLDRLSAATATAERLGGRLSSARGYSRELVQLLATRLHVLSAALDGLDVREASDATVTIRAGKADDADACRRFVEELATMYVGWADGRGMRVRRKDEGGGVVLEVVGLGAYTLLKSEIGLHVLELPQVDSRSFDRATVLVDVEPWGWNRTAVRPSAPSRPSCVATDTTRRRSSATPRAPEPAGSTGCSPATSTCCAAAAD